MNSRLVLPSGAWLEVTRPMIDVTDFGSSYFAVARRTEYWLRHLPVTALQAGQLTAARNVWVRTDRQGYFIAAAEITLEEARAIADGKDPYAVLAGTMPLMIVAKAE